LLFFFLNMLSLFVTSRLAYKPLPFFSWCPMKKFPEIASKTMRGSSREKDLYTSSSSSQEKPVVVVVAAFESKLPREQRHCRRFFAAPRWWWWLKGVNIFIIIILIIVAFIYDSMCSLLFSIVSPGLFGNAVGSILLYHHHHPAAYDWKKYI